MKIRFWSDFACPYCYIGEKRLRDAMDSLNVADQIELEPMAFELDPGASRTVQSDTVTRFGKKYRLPPDETRAQVEHISKLGHACGLDFKYADSRYTNTFDAHRLMKLAEATDRKILEKLNFALFDAYFAKSQELADHAVLMRIGKEAGLNEDAIRSVLESDKYGAEVRADEAAAAKAGVRGVPFFIFEDGVTIPGAASQADFEEIIRRNLKGAKISGQGVGETCGAHGCQIRRQPS